MEPACVHAGLYDAEAAPGRSCGLALNGFAAVAKKIECLSSILLHAVFDVLSNSRDDMKAAARRRAHSRPACRTLSDFVDPVRGELNAVWARHPRMVAGTDTSVPHGRARRHPDCGRVELGADGRYGGAARCRYSSKAADCAALKENAAVVSAPRLGAAQRTSRGDLYRPAPHNDAGKLRRSWVSIPSRRTCEIPGSACDPGHDDGAEDRGANASR